MQGLSFCAASVPKAGSDHNIIKGCFCPHYDYGLPEHVIFHVNTVTKPPELIKKGDRLDLMLEESKSWVIIADLEDNIPTRGQLADSTEFRNMKPGDKYYGVRFLKEVDEERYVKIREEVEMTFKSGKMVLAPKIVFWVVDNQVREINFFSEEGSYNVYSSEN